MAAHEFNIILQISCVTVLAVAGIFLFRHTQTTVNTWAGIGLIAAVLCYLVLETPFVQDHQVFFLVAVTGAISIPVVFFLLTKAIFDDHFKPSGTIALLFALQIGAHFWVYAKDLLALQTWVQQLFYTLSQVISIGFVLAGIYTAIKTKKGDLIESRMKFRNIFVMITAALIGITLIVESMPIVRASLDYLQIMQRSSILGLTLFFLINNFEIKAGFFFNEKPIEKPMVVDDKGLRRKLEMLIEEKKIYRKEGITIG